MRSAIVLTLSLACLSCGEGQPVYTFEAKQPAQSAAPWPAMASAESQLSGNDEPTDPSLGAWQKDAATEIGCATSPRLASQINNALLQSASGMAHEAPVVSSRVSFRRVAEDGLTVRVDAQVEQKRLVSDTQELVLVEHHLLHERTGWLTSGEDCRAKMIRNCRRVCSHGLLESENNIVMKWDGKRRDECHTDGSLVDLGGTQRGVWCAVYERHPTNCAHPPALAEHPITDCAYRPVHLAATFRSEFTCTFTGSWTCHGTTKLADCHTLMLTAGPPIGNECTAISELTSPAWTTEQAASLGSEISTILSRH